MTYTETTQQIVNSPDGNESILVSVTQQITEELDYISGTGNSSEVLYFEQDEIGIYNWLTLEYLTGYTF